MAPAARPNDVACAASLVGGWPCGPAVADAAAFQVPRPSSVAVPAWPVRLSGAGDRTAADAFAAYEDRAEIAARPINSAPADPVATHATTQDGDAVDEGVDTHVHGAEGTANASQIDAETVRPARPETVLRRSWLFRIVKSRPEIACLVRP